MKERIFLELEKFQNRFLWFYNKIKFSDVNFLFDLLFDPQIYYFLFLNKKEPKPNENFITDCLSYAQK